MAGGEVGPELHAAAGGNRFTGAQLDHLALTQPVGQGRFQLGVAAHHTSELLLEPVQAADVVAVAVGDQDGGDAGLPQFGVEIQYLFRPGAVGLA